MLHIIYVIKSNEKWKIKLKAKKKKPRTKRFHLETFI